LRRVLLDGFEDSRVLSRKVDALRVDRANADACP
jgi:hypothetical protein